jgi:RHS repeat-associated protein
VPLLAPLPSKEFRCQASRRRARSTLSYACNGRNDDGNLLSDGRWSYEWDWDGARQRGDGASPDPAQREKGGFDRAPSGRADEQNRLRRMETLPAAIAAGVPGRRIDFAYDDRSRKVRKTVRSGATYATVEADVGYLYHDWNLLREYDLQANGTVLRSYYWGVDLSGTLQVAGGVGGLVAAELDTGDGWQRPVAYGYDGNGNVTDLVSIAEGGYIARYDYDAFGNVFASGWDAAINPFRFSTKYAETDAKVGGRDLGLVYYGYRFYSPGMGRWINRDPIEERGGLNLYGFLHNDASARIDYLGLCDQEGCPNPPGLTQWDSRCCGGKPMRPMDECCGGKIYRYENDELCCGNANVGAVYARNYGVHGMPCCRSSIDGSLGTWLHIYEELGMSRRECIRHLLGARHDNPYDVRDLVEPPLNPPPINGKPGIGKGDIIEIGKIIGSTAIAEAYCRKLTCGNKRMGNGGQ